MSFKTILLADFGPKPGSFEINFINSSISLIFCIYYSGHLKPGIPNPPVAFDISSDVFDFNCDLALLCAATIKSSIIDLSSFIISSDSLIDCISPSPSKTIFAEFEPEIPSIEGISGSNSAKIVLDGEGEMQSIKLSDEIMKEDKSIIEDLIVAAHNNAKSQLKSKTSEEISKATGGFGIPGFKWPL